MFFVNLMNKYLPEPFTVAWLLTVIVVALTLVFTSATPGSDPRVLGRRLL